MRLDPNDRLCPRCSGKIINRHYSAKFCGNCPPPKRRVAASEPKHQCCRDCLATFQSTDVAAPGYLKGMGGWLRPQRCDKCRSLRFNIKQAILTRAHATVSCAVRKGLLPRVHTLKCVDCGEQAQDYEHRDYNHLLFVQPVCRACNLRRGPGVFPHPFEAYGAPPPVPCELCEQEKDKVKDAHYWSAALNDYLARHFGQPLL
jgi:hypothetical protein